jgi:hypothetical protein
MKLTGSILPLSLIVQRQLDIIVRDLLQGNANVIADAPVGPGQKKFSLISAEGRKNFSCADFRRWKTQKFAEN